MSLGDQLLVKLPLAGPSGHTKLPPFPKFAMSERFVLLEMLNAAPINPFPSRRLSAYRARGTLAISEIGTRTLDFGTAMYRFLLGVSTEEMIDNNSGFAGC